MKYVRYADDFLCGVIGSREDAIKIKADIKEYLESKLRLNYPKRRPLSPTQIILRSFSALKSETENVRKHAETHSVERKGLGIKRLRFVSLKIRSRKSFSIMTLWK